MPENSVLEEAHRQLSVCSACRYCEGFCAVFPELSSRSTLDHGGISYLANLCHDCRDCYDACMFAPPHEFNVNIPKVLADVRVETYERYNWPRAAAVLCKSSPWPTIAIGLIAVALILLSVALRNGPDGIVSQYLGAGAFYKVVPYVAMVIPALAITAWGLFVVVSGARRFSMDADGSPQRLLHPGALLRAGWDAATLRWLEGGGVGCYYPDKRGSWERRLLHSLVFWGFLSDLVSTTLAFVYQDFLHLVPPYAVLSAPVLFGLAGGVLIVVGCTGLLLAKRKSDPVPTAPEMTRMDYAFLIVLDTVALTGLLTLFLRGTVAMPLIAAVHLGAVAAFFITAPYSKFVHFVYRYLALVKMYVDKKSAAA